jgi:hypothetical protein
MDIIDWAYVNHYRVPWRKKNRPIPAQTPSRSQTITYKTEPPDIIVTGKTTRVVFDIVDVGGRKDMTLGAPWH